MIRTFSQRFLLSSLNEQLKKFSRNSSSFPTKYISTKNKKLFPPENGHIQNSIYSEDVTVPDCLIHEYIWNDLQKWSDKTALVCGITGRKYSYAKLRDYCASLAASLQHVFKIKDGDVVAIALPNVPEYPIATLGILEAGAIMTSLNPIYTAEEMANQLVHSRSKLVFCLVDSVHVVQRAIELSKFPITLVVIKTKENQSLPSGTVDFNELILFKGTVNISSDRKSSDVAFLPYSSGTTGLPKGCELTHFNIISNSEMISQKLGDSYMAQPATAEFQEIVPCVLPFFHIYGFTCTLMSKLNLGCKLVTLPKFTPETFVKCLEEHKSTQIVLVPPILLYMANTDKITAKLLETTRIIMSGAAPLGSKDVERFKKKAPHVEFSQGYGLTETSPVTMLQGFGSRNYASVGSPSPATQAKIIKPDDEYFIGLGPNNSGELCVRGSHVMKGYLNNEKATSQTIIKDEKHDADAYPWLRTGDIGYFDELGQFYITDRLKELIKVKGFQVAPAQLESILRQHPEVADAAVIGVKHERFGEIPRAYVTLKNGSNGTKAEEIQQFVADKVAEYKRLEGGVVFIDQIPRTNTGKILRRVLKEQSA